MLLLPMTTEQLRRHMQVYKIELRSHVVLIIWSTMRTADLYNINDVEISYCLPITGTCFIQKIYAPSSSLYFKFIYIYMYVSCGQKCQYFLLVRLQWPVLSGLQGPCTHIAILLTVTDLLVEDRGDNNLLVIVLSVLHPFTAPGFPFWCL